MKLDTFHDLLHTLCRLDFLDWFDAMSMRKMARNREMVQEWDKWINE